MGEVSDENRNEHHTNWLYELVPRCHVRCLVMAFQIDSIMLPVKELGSHQYAMNEGGAGF